MIALPARREPGTLVVRRASVPHDGRATLDERIDAAVDDAVATALAKVSTPADQELAKQQQAFDQLLQAKAEQQREANAIRDMELEQLKRDEEVLKKWIEMI